MNTRPSCLLSYAVILSCSGALLGCNSPKAPTDGAAKVADNKPPDDKPPVTTSVNGVSALPVSPECRKQVDDLQALVTGQPSALPFYASPQNVDQLARVFEGVFDRGQPGPTVTVTAEGFSVDGDPLQGREQLAKALQKFRQSEGGHSKHKIVYLEAAGELKAKRVAEVADMVQAIDGKAGEIRLLVALDWVRPVVKTTNPKFAEWEAKASVDMYRRQHMVLRKIQNEVSQCDQARKVWVDPSSRGLPFEELRSKILSAVMSCDCNGVDMAMLAPLMETASFGRPGYGWIEYHPELFLPIAWSSNAGEVSKAMAEHEDPAARQ